MLKTVTKSRPEGAGSPVEIAIVGEIGNGAYSGADLERAVAGARGRSIHLVVDSPGGRVSDGLKAYRAFQAHSHRVTATILRAESMAAIIALAADHREIAPDGVMMLHAPIIPTVENSTANDLRATAVRMDEIADDFAQIVAARAGWTLENAKVILDLDVTFSEAEAVAAGLAHAIAHDVPPSKPSTPRMSVRPIAGPYRSARPAGAVRLFAYDAKPIQTGERVRHQGRLYAATRPALGAPGFEPHIDRQTWRSC